MVHGRDKDMINRGGEKISAEEVEGICYRVDGVEMAAAVAMPDAELGERLCVYLVVRPGHPTPFLEEVRTAFARAEVARYKYPDRIEVVDRLPMTKVGKINKRALRQDIAERLHQTPAPEEIVR